MQNKWDRIRRAKSVNLLKSAALQLTVIVLKTVEHYREFEFPQRIGTAYATDPRAAENSKSIENVSRAVIRLYQQTANLATVIRLAYNISLRGSRM